MLIKLPGEKRKGVFEKKISQNFPKLMKVTNPEIQEVQSKHNEESNPHQSDLAEN